MCTQTSWPGSEGWEDSGVVTLSAKGIVRPMICFVKPETTRYCDFLLGQSQYVDCTRSKPQPQIQVEHRDLRGV